MQVWRRVARFALRTIVLMFSMLMFSVPVLAKGGGGTGGGGGGGGGGGSSGSSYSRSYSGGGATYGRSTTYVRMTPTAGELRMQELRDLRRRLLDLDLEQVDATVAGSATAVAVEQKRAILQARITALQGEMINDRVIWGGLSTVVVIAGCAAVGAAATGGQPSPSSSSKYARGLSADEQKRFARLQTESSNETLARRLVDVGGGDVGGGDVGGGDAAEAGVSPSMSPQELASGTCRLKDGSWLGTYLEDGNKGFTKYFLFFKPTGGSCFQFSGQGEDEGSPPWTLPPGPSPPWSPPMDPLVPSDPPLTRLSDRHR